jgi:hypothetical protein
LSEAEDPRRLQRKEREREVTVEDVRQLMGASTPHFALQLRNRIAKLIEGLPAEHPARLEGELEIARLQALGVTGEVRGAPPAEGERPLPSVELAGELPLALEPR